MCQTYQRNFPFLLFTVGNASTFPLSQVLWRLKGPGHISNVLGFTQALGDNGSYTLYRNLTHPCNITGSNPNYIYISVYFVFYFISDSTL